MPSNAVVRARVDEHIKAEATEVLEEMGLTVSDLIRMTMTKVANEHAIPFELKVPNAETRAAMEEARAIQKARRARFKNGQDLINALEKEAGE
jgi:DNA-damage-inducible protein J